MSPTPVKNTRPGCQDGLRARIGGIWRLAWGSRFRARRQYAEHPEAERARARYQARRDKGDGRGAGPVGGS